MSNVCHKTLINLGAVALNLGPNVGSRQLHTTRLAISTNSNIFNLIKKDSSIDTQSDKEFERTKDCGSESSSKESYQKYHRKKYERKRNEYQNSRTTHDQQGGGGGGDEGTSKPLMSHYQRLNVDPGADLNAIKSAYYSLSKIYHPDIVGTEDSNAIENFRLITESYDVLSDPKLRAEYDYQFDSVSVIDHVSRQRHTNRDYNVVFRSRNADMIFKFRQDAAILREKEKNPQKFRAGVFVDNESRAPSVVKLSELKERLRQLEKPVQRGSNKLDGSEFYRMHLYDTILRRHSDLVKNNPADGRYQASKDADGGTIVQNLAIIAGALIIILVIVLSQSLAIFLDKRLEGDEP